MSKVLIITKSFLTHDRQNALCIERVAECLKNYGHIIDYLSWEQDVPTSSETNVYTVVEPEYVNGYRNQLRKIVKLLNVPLNSLSLVNKLYLAIKKLIYRFDYTTVVAVVNPAEGAEALYRIKKENPSINTILYEIDPSSNRYKTPKAISEIVWQKKSIIWEQKIYSTFDHIIHMQTHKAHYNDKMFKKYQKKSIYLDIPGFIPQKNWEIQNSNSSRFLYCGAFYHKLREPYYMLKVIECLNRKKTCNLDIYTGKSMRSELIAASKKFDFLTIHNEVSQNELNDIIQQSDVLISIGNSYSDFLPSKTLMYMSTGKPIIHFYTDSHDVSLRYYKNYPAVLFINQQEKIDANKINKIYDFLLRIKSGYSIDSGKLYNSLYMNTPEYSAKKINELII